MINDENPTSELYSLFQVYLNFSGKTILGYHHILEGARYPPKFQAIITLAGCILDVRPQLTFLFSIKGK